MIQISRWRRLFEYVRYPRFGFSRASQYGIRLSIDVPDDALMALSLDFDKSNDDWVRFFDRLIQPVTAAGVTTLLIDNVGHSEEAKRRAKGASAKSDRADLTVGRVYEVLEEDHGMYRVVDDSGDDFLYPKRMFRIVASE